MTGRKLWMFTMDTARVVLFIVGLVFGGVILGAATATVAIYLFPPHHTVTNTTGGAGR